MPGASTAAIIGASAIAGGAQIAGSALSARTGTTKAPPPVPVFPGAQANYLEQLGVTGKDGLGPTSLSTLTDMAKTGAPTNVGPAWTAMVDAQKRLVAEGTGNILEQFGSTGLRYSSDLMNKLVDYQSQTTKDQEALLAGMTVSASEAAKARQLSAAGAGADAFASVATAETPSAYVTTGGGPVAAGIGAGGNVLQTLAMMKMLFPSASTPTNLGPSAASTVPFGVTDTPNVPPAWMQFANPTNFGPAAGVSA